MYSMALMAAEGFTAPAMPVASMRAGPVAMKAMSEALPFSERPAGLDAVTLAGDVGFDPLGFSNPELGPFADSPFDSATAHMGWMREAEIKHGRVCMLATVGWISADLGLRAPGVPSELKAAGVTSYAAHDIAVADGRLLMLIILCGVFEIAGSAAIKATLEGKREPGDFALMGGFKNVDAKKLAALKQAEIKHCRLGMMAFSGIATQTAVQGGEIGFPYF